MSDPTSQNPTTPTQQAPASTEPLTFDLQVAEELREAALAVFTRHPEVACLGMAISWKNGLNDNQEIVHGLWLTPDGQVVASPPDVIGSAWQTLKLLDQQLARAAQCIQYYERLLVEVTGKVKEAYEELQKVQAQKPVPG